MDFFLEIGLFFFFLIDWNGMELRGKCEEWSLKGGGGGF